MSATDATLASLNEASEQCRIRSLAAGERRDWDIESSEAGAALTIDLSMAHVPATSLAGVLIKARTARLYTTGDDFEELDNLWLSITDDLERLVGGGAERVE